MSVRQFNGTDDVITFDNGGLASVSGGITFAMLMKHTNASAAGNMFMPQHSFPAQTYTLYWDTNKLVVWVNAAGISLDTTITGGSAQGWAIYVVTKVSGTTVARGHRFPIGGSWTRANSAGTSANATEAINNILFGFGWGNGLPTKVATAAIWNVALSDAQVSELSANLRTADWFSNSGGAPAVLWDFNQASVATPVPDLMGGGADQTAITGTTAVGGDNPAGWTFGLSTPQIILPDADTTTTGWTSTPLHSKLADSSDATVITATLA